MADEKILNQEVQEEQVQEGAPEIVEQPNEEPQGETSEELTPESPVEEPSPEDLLIQKKEPTQEELYQKLAQYATKEELTDEDWQEIEKMGISKEVAELAIEGLKTKFTATVNQLYEIVGGKEQYQAMAQWAAENLSKDEIEEFNTLMRSGDLRAMKWALRGLKAAYLEATNTPTTLHGTKATAKPSIKPYKSFQEAVEDMKKPEYKKDPAFRQLVEQRLAISKFE